VGFEFYFSGEKVPVTRKVQELGWESVEKVWEEKTRA
jgi:hypothetical protein